MRMAQTAKDTTNFLFKAPLCLVNASLDMTQYFSPWAAQRRFWDGWQHLNEQWLSLFSLSTKLWMQHAAQGVKKSQRPAEALVASLEETRRNAAQVAQSPQSEAPQALNHLRDLQKQITEAAYLKAEEQGLIPDATQDAQQALERARDFQKQITEAAYLKAEEQGLIPSHAEQARQALERTQDLQKQIAEVAYLKAEERGFAPGYEQQDWEEAEQQVTGQISS